MLVRCCEPSPCATTATPSLCACVLALQVLMHTASESPLSALTTLCRMAARDDSRAADGGGKSRLHELLPSLCLAFSLLGSAHLSGSAAADQLQRLQQTLVQVRCCAARTAAWMRKHDHVLAWLRPGLE